MFIRPDWRDKGAYKWMLHGPVHGAIAWEFIRRNPDYHKDVTPYQNEVIDFRRDNPTSFDEGESSFEFPERFSAMVCCHMFHRPERFKFWRTYFVNRWRLHRPMLPDEQVHGEEIIFTTIDQFESFKVQGLTSPVTQSRVLIPVDLSRPLEEIQEQLFFQVRRLREEGIRDGTIKPQTNRTLAPRVYVEQLRILDAFDEGATVREIGHVLSPGAVNDIDARQLDKRINAAHVAAKKMLESGWRVLLPGS